MTDIEEATAKVDRDQMLYDRAIRALVVLVGVATAFGLGAGLWLGVQLREQNDVITKQGSAIEAILQTQTDNAKTRTTLISKAIDEIDANQRKLIADHDRKIELLVRRVVATTTAEVQAPENQEAGKP